MRQPGLNERTLPAALVTCGCGSKLPVMSGDRVDDRFAVTLVQLAESITLALESVSETASALGWRPSSPTFTTEALQLALFEIAELPLKIMSERPAEIVPAKPRSNRLRTGDPTSR